MDPKEAGYKGVHMFKRMLPYVSMQFNFLMPVLHSLLFGVVCKFVVTTLEGHKRYSQKLKVRSKE